MGTVGLLDWLDLNEMFGAALGLAEPWRVTSVEFDQEAGRLDLGLDFLGAPGSAAPSRDAPRRRARCMTRRRRPARSTPTNRRSARADRRSSSLITCSSLCGDRTLTSDRPQERRDDRRSRSHAAESADRRLPVTAPTHVL